SGLSLRGMLKIHSTRLSALRALYGLRRLIKSRALVRATSRSRPTSFSNGGTLGSARMRRPLRTVLRRGCCCSNGCSALTDMATWDSAGRDQE
ncbi:hypothetical protein MPH_06494, partial [Macrophomina phaseolina MS6]